MYHIIWQYLKTEHRRTSQSRMERDEPRQQSGKPTRAQAGPVHRYVSVHPIVVVRAGQVTKGTNLREKCRSSICEGCQVRRITKRSGSKSRRVRADQGDNANLQQETSRSGMSSVPIKAHIRAMKVWVDLRIGILPMIGHGSSDWSSSFGQGRVVPWVKRPKETEKPDRVFPCEKALAVQFYRRNSYLGHYRDILKSCNKPKAGRSEPGYTGYTRRSHSFVTSLRSRGKHLVKHLQPWARRECELPRQQTSKPGKTQVGENNSRYILATCRARMKSSWEPKEQQG